MSQLHNDEIYPNISGSISTEHRYTGFWNCDCICGLQYGQTPTGKNFVILTELPHNKGTSVTNMVEQLVTQVLRQLGFSPADTIIFEHYPERGSKWNSLPETWDLILPDWENGIAKCPQDRHMWKSVTRKQALAMIT